MKLLFTLLVITLLALAGSSSLCEENKDKAREAFNNGKKLFNSGEFAKAADSFRKANELFPNWKIYYNLGQSEAAAKRYGLCLEAFEKYLAEGGDEIAEDRVQEIQTEIDRLQRIVGFLKVKAPDGTTVKVDGLARGTAPITRELPVAASVSHVVSAVSDGEVLAEQDFQVSGGRTATIDLTEPKPPEEDVKLDSEVEVELEKQTDEPEEGKSSLKTWGWVSLGLGGAVLVGGGITGIAALQANGKVKDECPDGCYSDNYGLIEKRDNLALATDVLLGVGGAIALTGIVLLIVDAAGRESDNPEIAFVPSPGAFAIVGRF